MELDCLIVHVPKLWVWGPGIGFHARVNFVATGLWSMAEEMIGQGLRCRIIHLGVELLLDPEFRLVDYLRTNPAGVVAFSLHWHPQTYDTLEQARLVKESFPECRIVMGGYTAAYFAGEILRHFSWVDAVFKGEGEMPLARYVMYCSRSLGELAHIPNLIWRYEDKILDNPDRWSASEADLGEWTFASLDVMNNLETYLRVKWLIPWEKEVAWIFRRNSRFRQPTFFGVMLGRGCPGECSWCGGGKRTAHWFGQSGATVRRPPEKVVETIYLLRQKYRVERFYICFDPAPHNEEYNFQLLAALNVLKPSVIIDFECFGLPSRNLIQYLKHKVHHDSRIILSPETVDETVRHLHRTWPFSNEDLEDRLELLSQLHIHTVLYFATGLPGETPDDWRRTVAYARRLKKEYPCVSRYSVFPVEMEPGAPWYEEPGRFGIELRRKSLLDFYSDHAQPDPTLGYSLGDWSEMDLIRKGSTIGGTGNARIMGIIRYIIKTGMPLCTSRTLSKVRPYGTRA